MADLLEVAQRHQRRIIKRSDRAVARAVAAWTAIDMANLDRSWQAVEPAVTAVAVAAQNLNAADADRYMNQAARAYGDPRATMSVNSSSFAGVDASGREPRRAAVWCGDDDEAVHRFREDSAAGVCRRSDVPGGDDEDGAA